MQSKATSASSVPHLPLILLELHQSFLHPQLASPRPTVCHSAHLPRPRPLNSGTDFVTCWGRSATNCLRSAKSFRSGTAPGTGWFPQKLKAESWVVLPTSCGKPGFLGFSHPEGESSSSSGLERIRSCVSCLMKNPCSVCHRGSVLLVSHGYESSTSL